MNGHPFCYHDYREYDKVVLPTIETIDEQVTDMYLRTSELLNRPSYYRDKMERAEERYEFAKSKAQSISGLRYDKDRVQSSNCCGQEDALIEMIDAKEAYEQARMLYVCSKIETDILIERSNTTAKQKMVLRYRYSNDKQLSYSQIARLMGVKTHTAENIHTRAFANLALWLEGQGVA